MYDPLTDPHPEAGALGAASYWQKAAPKAPADDGPLQGDDTAEVAIIGGGYSGLSAALALARDHGIRAVVLEAASASWGCSGRNGSFARISGGRVPHATLIRTYGLETAKAFFDELRSGLDTVRRLIDEGGIDCDRQPDGVFKVAAFASQPAKLRAEAELYNRAYGYPARFVAGEELHGTHEGPESFGALHLPDGFAMHPLKLAYGIQRMARVAGAILHTRSPVVDWTLANGVHHLRTPGGTLRARKVIVATNGYTSSRLHPRLKGRVLPVHSQIIVTAPMTDAQVAASLPSSACMFDTRELLFYYRRLPDNRMLFGGRSAITGTDSEHLRHRDYLVDAMTRKFPVLAGIGIDYWWGGWVAVSWNYLPFCYRVQGLGETYWSGGCAGSGVTYAIHMGTRLAQMAAGVPFETRAAFLTREPRRYPMLPFVRIGQAIAYRMLHRKDTKLAAAK